MLRSRLAHRYAILDIQNNRFLGADAESRALVEVVTSFSTYSQQIMAY